jgi:hypothetical protein
MCLRPRRITGVRNFRQALASPHPGCRIHDPHAADLLAIGREPKSMTKLFRICSIAILTAVVAAGCAARGVRIAELKDHPDKYERKTVSVEGVVTGSLGASILSQIVPFQSYTVDDGTGEIRVLARSSRTVPRAGSRVRVKGQVSELGVFGGRSIGLHLQEDDRKIKD